MNSFIFLVIILLSSLTSRHFANVAPIMVLFEENHDSMLIDDTFDHSNNFSLLSKESGVNSFGLNSSEDLPPIPKESEDLSSISEGSDNNHFWFYNSKESLVQPQDNLLFNDGSVQGQIDSRLGDKISIVAPEKETIKVASIPTAISNKKTPTSNYPHQDLSNFSALFSGEFKDISVKIKMSNDTEFPMVSVEMPGMESTEDNCYIISLRPETPPEVLEMLSSYLETYISAQTIFIFQNVFKGCHFCFPKGIESIMPLETIRQIPWISLIEHDSIISMARSTPSNFDNYQATDETEPQSYHVQQNAPWGLVRISQPKRPLNDRCYEYSTNGTGVNIYIIDSGIDLNHPGEFFVLIYPYSIS